jgi:predicted nucleic acid-binding protein
MRVVDTNLLVYLLLPTPYTAQAEAIMGVDSDWIAPFVKNVFVTLDVRSLCQNTDTRWNQVP